MDNEALDRMTMALMGTSPTDEAQMALLDTQPVVPILPEANVIKIGGQSFIDRGRAAVFPLIEELVENLPRHKMIIGTGAGTRAIRYRATRRGQSKPRPLYVTSHAVDGM